MLYETTYFVGDGILSSVSASSFFPSVSKSVLARGIEGK